VSGSVKVTVTPNTAERLRQIILKVTVLSYSGYDAISATLPEAETLLRREQFALVVVSAWLSEWERCRILAAAGKTPTYVLTELTLADELLAEVGRLLRM
jgi:hypothetical protein